MDEADIKVRVWSGVKGGFMQFQAYHEGLGIEGQIVTVKPHYAENGRLMALHNLIKVYEKQCEKLTQQSS